MAIDRSQERPIIKKSDREVIECDPSWRLPLYSDRYEAKAAELEGLSRTDVMRLDRYKLRYSLESHGFSSDQAARLLFLKWELQRGR